MSHSHITNYQRVPSINARFGGFINLGITKSVFHKIQIMVGVAKRRTGPPNKSTKVTSGKLSHNKLENHHV